MAGCLSPTTFPRVPGDTSHNRTAIRAEYDSNISHTQWHLLRQWTAFRVTDVPPRNQMEKALAHELVDKLAHNQAYVMLNVRNVFWDCLPLEIPYNYLEYSLRLNPKLLFQILLRISSKHVLYAYYLPLYQKGRLEKILLSCPWHSGFDPGKWSIVATSGTGCAIPHY